jgi:5-methylcytosine-specific restriction endonuclease McrA
MHQNGRPKAEKPKAPTIKASELLAILKRQNYRCAASGRPLTPQTASIDHKVAVARGGEHGIDNLWILHVEANAAKGTLSVEEFVQLCRDVVNFMDRPPGATAEPVPVAPPDHDLFSTQRPEEAI